MKEQIPKDLTGISLSLIRYSIFKSAVFKGFPVFESRN